MDEVAMKDDIPRCYSCRNPQSTHMDFLDFMESRKQDEEEIPIETEKDEVEIIDT